LGISHIYLPFLTNPGGHFGLIPDIDFLIFPFMQLIVVFLDKPAAALSAAALSAAALSAAALSAAALSAAAFAAAFAAITESIQVEGVELLVPRFIGRHS
jgi:hypothetical protein